MKLRSAQQCITLATRDHHSDEFDTRLNHVNPVCQIDRTRTIHRLRKFSAPHLLPFDDARVPPAFTDGILDPSNVNSPLPHKRHRAVADLRASHGTEVPSTVVDEEPATERSAETQ